MWLPFTSKSEVDTPSDIIIPDFLLFVNTTYRGGDILIPEQITTPVLKVEDLTHILSIRRNTAYELVRSGKIHSVKIGRTYRIPRSAVEDDLNPPEETGIM